MNISIIEPKNETHAPAVSNSLSGRRLALAWVLFVGAVGITLAVFFGSLPTYLALLQLTVTLALLYLGSVILLQEIFAPLTGRSDLAIVGSTLAIASLFSPLRQSIQAVIDRRFYRRKYDAAKTLARFGERIRDEIELARLSAELLAVVDETIRPAHVALWLRQPPSTQTWLSASSAARERET